MLTLVTCFAGVILILFVPSIGNIFWFEPILDMHALCLFCESFHRDVLRAKRLAQSVQKFNKNNIPFYIAVPEKDFKLFSEQLVGLPVTIIDDKTIIAANPNLSLKYIEDMPGKISQQVYKSEFWRLGLCENYFCLDSDCVFIRDFYISDFITSDGHPYSTIHEAKELLSFADRYHYKKVRLNFEKGSLTGQKIFNREGKLYEFGITPVVWSAKVWQTLDELWLKPQKINIAELINRYPQELQIYGESLLKFRPIPIWPCEPLFKVYHYEAQFFFDKKRGINDEMLSKNYLGVVRQSNWESFDYGAQNKNILSLTLKQIKRAFRYLSV